MKRQQKKAFTLVELLVVIAILAILASVAVVGYTSFIKNAAVSNDQALVEQVNRYMAALKNDSSEPEFYNKEFQSDAEILALISKIQDEGQFGELEPQAAKYGYHFYFDTIDQKFVVLDNDAAIEMGSGSPSGLGRHFFSMLVGAAGEGTYQSLSPFRSFTKGGRYFFADTKGEWADIIRSFFTVTSLNKTDGDNSLEQLKESAANIKVGNIPVPGFEALVDSTVFVTETGNHVVSSTGTHTNVQVQPEATKKVDENGNVVIDEETGEEVKNTYVISGTKTGLGGEEDKVTIGETVGETTITLFTPKAEDGDHEIIIPSDVTYVSPDFINVGNETVEEPDGTVTPTTNVTVSFETTKEDPQEIANEIASKLEITANTESVTVSATVKNPDATTSTKEVTVEKDPTSDELVVTVEQATAAVETKNKVNDFIINVVDKDSNDNDSNKVSGNCVAWDGETFTLNASEFKGEVAGQPVLDETVTWSIKSASGEDENVNYASLVTIDAETGVLTFLTDNGNAPKINQVVVLATANDGSNHFEELTLDVVRIQDFAINVVDTGDKVNGSFVAWDGKEFDLNVNYASYVPNHVVEGITLNELTFTYSLASTELANYVTVSPEGKITFADNGGIAPEIDTITVRATANNGIFKDYEIKVVRVTGITDVTLGGKALNLDGNDAHYFMNTNTNGVNNSFALSYSADKVVDNWNGEGKAKVTLDVELSLSGNTETFSFGNGNSVALVGTLKDLPNAQSINVTIKNLKTVGVSLKMYNTDELNFQTIKTNGALRLVGDDNAITLGELFTLNNNMSVPANAQVWFTTGYNGTDTAPGIIDTGADEFGWSRYGTTTNINASNWAATEIQFKNGATNSAEAQEVYISIVIPTEEGYRRISDTRVLSVVDGYNVKSWTDMVAHAGNSVVVFTTDKIDITAGTTDTYTIPANKTFYGNGVTLDLSGAGATFSTGGIITLAGKIQDTKLIGPVYDSFGLQRNQEKGAAVITSSGTACEIENCYIAHARSPLVLYENSVITVKDSIFYGGTGANIILYANSTLKIDGKVATIQTGENGIIGGGIVGWIDDGYKHIEVLKDADLRQYNFVNSALAEKFPTILMVMPLSEPFNDLIKKEEYSGYWFGSNLDKAENRYVNSAIMTVDKYYGLTYSISDTSRTSETKVSTGLYKYCYKHETNHPLDFTLESDCCTKQVCVGIFGHTAPTEEFTNTLVSTVTLTLTRYVAVDMDYTISYDKTKFSHSDDTDGDGKITAKWTGTELTKAVTFNAIANIAWSQPNILGDPTYWSGFSVAQETPVMGITSTVAGNDGDTTISGVPGYTSTEYTWTVSEMIWKTAETFAEKLGASVHSFGLHSSTAVFDCHSTQNSNENAQAWFAEWQDMVAEGSAHEYHPNYTNTFGTTGKLFP